MMVLRNGSLFGQPPSLLEGHGQQISEEVESPGAGAFEQWRDLIGNVLGRLRAVSRDPGGPEPLGSDINPPARRFWPSPGQQQRLLCTNRYDPYTAFLPQTPGEAPTDFSIGILRC
jgi:hypothetical protein